MDIPISLIVGILLLSLGAAAGALLRTFTNMGRIVAIERMLEPIPQVHRDAASLKARVDSHQDQIRELKENIRDWRLENRSEHREDRELNAEDHARLVTLIKNGQRQ